MKATDTGIVMSQLYYYKLQYKDILMYTCNMSMNLMVLILDGNSERGAHDGSNLCNLIC